jgi:hypothetical protein
VGDADASPCGGTGTYWIVVSEQPTQIMLEGWPSCSIPIESVPSMYCIVQMNCERAREVSGEESPKA